jgi:fengycin family lipopeptide synthetase D
MTATSVSKEFQMKEIKPNSDVAIAASQSIRERNYWLEALSGQLKKTGLKGDWRPQGTGNRKEAAVKLTLPAPLSERLLKVSNGSDSRLHMVLTAGVKVLLHKLSGFRDIVIGTTIDKMEVEGRFVNTILPLRTTLAPGMTFKQLLMRVKTTINEAIDHQNYPVESLLNDLNLPFSTEDFPLFDVAVILENIQSRRYLDPITPGAVFCFHRRGEEIHLRLEYDASWFDAAFIERAAAYLNRVLEYALEHVETSLEAVPMLSPQEQKELLDGFNDTGRDYPLTSTLQRLFELQARKTPHLPALECGELSLTFERLDREAGRLAVLLRSRGVTAGTMVALMVERSWRMVVGILAILKAGGAYVPLDYTVPLDRNRFILKDAAVSSMISQRSLKDSCGELFEHLGEDNILWYDRLEEIDDLDGYSYEGDSGDAAYVIYTSGTSGKPKGVVVEHRNVVNFIHGLNETVYGNYEGPLRLALVSSFVFDASVQQTFGALLLGHTVVIVPEDVRADGARLLDFYREQKIDVSDGTPTHLNLLLQAMDLRQRDHCIKHFIIGGEVLALETVQEFFRGFDSPIPVVTNVYGPTECCVNATSFKIDPEILNSLKVIPIGAPSPNYKIVVLNPAGELSPIGVAGELCIGGEGVARGYLGRDALTAEKFVTLPLDGGMRVYRTGDLAAWNPDGTLDFIGRRDFQIKLRGYRIELEEIENRLRRQEGVKAAVVTLFEDATGDRRLAGYVVADEGLDIQELRWRLSRELPDYMIPSMLMRIDSIPMTSSCKVDRRNLPEPTYDTHDTYTPPGNDIQRELVDIWAEVLGMPGDDIGIDADFFEYGGHSLRATILVSLIHKAFNVQVPLAEIFRLPTIREQGVYIADAAQTQFHSIRPAPQKEYYELSPHQKRLYILHQMDRDHTNYNTTSVNLLEGDLDLPKLQGAFRGLIQRHEVLRTSFQIIDGQPVQQVHDDAPFAVECAAGQKEDVAAMVDDFVKPFDLTAAPLLRVLVIRLDEALHALVVGMHHIITDGFSKTVLINDFKALYEGTPLPSLTLHYKDYSEWLNAPDQKENILRQETFWLDEFSGSIPVLDIPSDFPRESIQDFIGKQVEFSIDRDTTAALKQLAKERGVTLFMLMLAAFNVLLARITGQTDVVVGTSIAGRRHADFEKIIGLFVNVLALRNQPTRDKPFTTFLGEVKHRTLAAFDNQDYPFDELVAQLKQDVIAGSPLISAVFNLDNLQRPDEMLRFRSGDSELLFKPYEFKDKITQADFLMECFEVEGMLMSWIKYRQNLFLEETIQRFIGYFKRILQAVIEEPDRSIGALTRMKGSKKRELLDQFNKDLSL